VSRHDLAPCDNACYVCKKETCIDCYFACCEDCSFSKSCERHIGYLKEKERSKISPLKERKCLSS
jgi:hypothetical protein